MESKNEKDNGVDRVNKELVIEELNLKFQVNDSIVY